MSETDLTAQLQSQDQGRIEARPSHLDQSDEDADLALEVQQNIDKSSGFVETWRAQAREDTRYYHGNQWSDLDRMRMEQTKRPALVFNEIGDKIDALSGLERLNRTDIRFVSRSPDTDLIHDTAGDLASDAVGAAIDLCDGEKETSRLAKDVAIGGMGWGEVALDFDDDIDGRVTFTRHNPMEFYWDHRAEKENIEDSNWRARVRDFPRSLFKKRWPDKIEMVDQAAPSYPEYKVGKYEMVTPYYSLQNEKANPEVGQQNAPKKTIRVTQYQWRDYETVYRIADQQNPEALEELSESEWKSLTAKAKLMGQPSPLAARQLKPIWKQVYIANGLVLEEPIVLPGAFSLFCLTGQWDSDKKVWYGIVRGLKDPQNVVNKAISAVVTEYISNVKGGVIYKQGTFQDPNYAKQQWAQPDGFIEASANANLAQDILQRQPKQLASAPPLLFTESKAAIARQSGINEDMLGFGSPDSGGPAISKRIQSALAILGWFFDNLERFRKTQARVMLEFIREYWSYGQLVRVGGDFNSKAIPLLKSELPLQYDLVVDQSVKYNPNLKQQIWTDILQVAPALMKTPIGQQFLLRAMKFSVLPTQLIAELQDLAQQASQQPPKQGRGKQDPPELTQAKVAKLSADAQKAIAEARNLDKRSGLEMAKTINDTVMRGHELRQKHEADVHNRLQARKQALLQQQSGVLNTPNGETTPPSPAPMGGSM